MPRIHEATLRGGSFFAKLFFLILRSRGIMYKDEEHEDFAGIEKGLSQAVVSKIHAVLPAKLLTVL